MEPVVATSGNRLQIVRAERTAEIGETVAVRCDQLPEAGHGKEEVALQSPRREAHGVADIPPLRRAGRARLGRRADRVTRPRGGPDPHASRAPAGVGIAPLGYATSRTRP
jgi:hypothetical protein